MVKGLLLLCDLQAAACGIFKGTRAAGREQSAIKNPGRLPGF